MSVMQTSTTVRVVVYCRVSTLDKGQDVENQLRELRQFVAHKTAEGWHLVGEYIDQASGKSANRPEFQRLFRDAAERGSDLLLFWALHRFSREGVVETLQHLELLKANGVQWWSFKEEFEEYWAVQRCRIGDFWHASPSRSGSVRLNGQKPGLERARAVGTKSGRPIGARP